nr:MAG: terminase large subunit [Caudoviricetes sp.]
MIRYTPKQRELLRLWKKNQLKRINLLEGSVSSGKTWVSLVLWAFWVAEMPKDKLYLMCAKSLTTLKRNCLILLQELVGERNFLFSISAKEGYLFGRRVLFEGANDARSESKIRGMTLQGAYCDELTQFPQDFFTMLLSRLRVPGAKLIATTNPDSPNHWLMTDYIKRADELDFLDVKFTVDDNTELPADYVDNIKKEYVGIFYDRFILGLWVMAQGRIYPMYDNTVETVDRPYEKYIVSMDYGTQNPTAMLLWGLCKGVWYAVREYYHSGRETNRQMTTGQYHDELDRLVGGLPVSKLIIDPSATPFIAEVNQRKRYKVWRANNDVMDGIQHTAQVLAEKKILFNDCCTRTIEEFALYRWDEKSAVDQPIKESDHAMDACRYFVNTTGIWRRKTEYTSLFM